MVVGVSDEKEISKLKKNLCLKRCAKICQLQCWFQN